MKLPHAPEHLQAAPPPAAESLPRRAWGLPPVYTWRSVVAVLLVGACLVISGENVGMGKTISLLTQWAGRALGFVEHSQVDDAVRRLGSAMFPIQLAEKTAVDRIADFDPNHLPIFSRVESQETVVKEVNPSTFETELITTRQEYLVEPVGYLWKVLKKMAQTFEIGVWGTLVGIILSAPLAVLGARNYSPYRWTYLLVRGIVSFCRSVPELISALFLVLAFGFGPPAGILALGIHAVGFLGKFFAEDIESADREPQKALEATGAGRLRVLWMGVIPQILPQYIAYALYILDRNVRMATVIGIVGAGGIGQELKGRYDMFEYGHVATILLVIFITVFVLDQVAAWLRAKIL